MGAHHTRTNVAGLQTGTQDLTAHRVTLTRPRNWSCEPRGAMAAFISRAHVCRHHSRRCEEKQGPSTALLSCTVPRAPHLRSVPLRRRAGWSRKSLRLLQGRGAHRYLLISLPCVQTVIPTIDGNYRDASQGNKQSIESILMIPLTSNSLCRDGTIGPIDRDVQFL